MANQISSLLFLCLFCFASISCQLRSDYSVEFAEINDQGLAMFHVYNNTNNDITRMSFELTYLNAENEVVLIDTVSYSMSKSSVSQFFLKAGGETFFVQKVPPNTTKASGKAISAKIN